jgi:subfamily B ATP-binding cassette protein MsbA
LKTFLRAIQLTQPIGGIALAYFIYAFFYNVFGLVNFVLLKPLLDVLFNSVEPTALQKYLTPPDFSWSLAYFERTFNYYFAQIIVHYDKFTALQFVCVIIVISVLCKNLFYYLSMLTRESIKVNVIKNARGKLYHKITALQLGYFSNQRKGDLLARMTADVGEVEGASQFGLDLVLRDPLALILHFVILFSISVEMTLFTLLILPISGGLIALLSKKLRRKSIAGQQYIANVVSIVEETLGALRIIKAYNATGYVRQKFDDANQQYGRQIYSIARTRELASPFSEFAGVFVVALILLYGGSLILSDNSSLSASEFIMYLVIFSQIITPAKAISTAIGNIQRGLAASERIFEILDTPTQIQDQTNAQKLTSFEQQIAFKDVSFRYEERWILQNINFTLQKGEKVALVGETGSGKSTIADLIPRFYDVQVGEVLIDGINVKNLQNESLLDKMGIVTQEAILFNDTIYNNIAFGTPHARPEAVEQAAQIANAHDFILKTEQGYQTVVGDRGMKLSGGQKQRITIARAILKNPPILILDEATSALDTESEKLVQDALHNLMQHRTALIIAHRLSTVQDADKILVLKNGQIVEEGNHETLMQKEDGIYKRLNLLQTN